MSSRCYSYHESHYQTLLAISNSRIDSELDIREERGPSLELDTREESREEDRGGERRRGEEERGGEERGADTTRSKYDATCV